eukprot:1558-Chlamydomonas_euryale.AAC.4
MARVPAGRRGRVLGKRLKRTPSIPPHRACSLAKRASLLSEARGLFALATPAAAGWERPRLGRIEKAVAVTRGEELLVAMQLDFGGGARKAVKVRARKETPGGKEIGGL